MKLAVLPAMAGLCLSSQAFAFSATECRGEFYNYCEPTEIPAFTTGSSLSLSNTSLSDTDNIGLPEASMTPRHLYGSSDEDWQYLKEQSYTILGLSFATVGLMTFLPESITNWSPEDRDMSRLASKWWDNVSAGPVWDKDDHYLNYIMHPYFGGVYYNAARHAGYDEWKSFMYSFTMSTFFWEYGVEAFAEVPSIQDIIVTPVFGAAVVVVVQPK